MSILGKFWFPAAVVGLAIAGTLAGSTPTHRTFDLVASVPDTVIYPKAAYKLNRKGGMEDIALSDSLIKAMQGSFGQAGDDDFIDLQMLVEYIRRVRNGLLSGRCHPHG